MLMDTVLANDIDVRYLQHVVEYVETPDKGGVKLADGEMLYADLVIAADGIRSKSWQVVTGEEPKTYSSGSAIFRCAYPTSEAMKIPSIREHWDISKTGETMHFFLGSVSHGIMLIGKEKICWGWMHRDDGTTSKESWSAKLSAETALKQLHGDGEWSPEYLAVVEATPPQQHHPLETRVARSSQGLGVAQGARGTDWRCRSCFLAYVGEWWYASVRRRCVPTLLSAYGIGSARLGWHTNSGKGTQHATT